MDKLLYALFGRYLGKTVVLSNGEGSTKLGVLTDVVYQPHYATKTMQFEFVLDGERVSGLWFIEGVAK